MRSFFDDFGLGEADAGGGGGAAWIGPALQAAAIAAPVAAALFSKGDAAADAAKAQKSAQKHERKMLEALLKADNRRAGLERQTKLVEMFSPAARSQVRAAERAPMLEALVALRGLRPAPYDTGFRAAPTSLVVSPFDFSRRAPAIARQRAPAPSTPARSALVPAAVIVGGLMLARRLFKR